MAEIDISKYDISCPSCRDGTLLVLCEDDYWRCPKTGDSMRLTTEQLPMFPKPIQPPHPLRDNPRSAEARMHKQMSDARSHLGRALYECQLTCDMSPKGTHNVTVCAGCRIRKSIELALGDLEA